MAKKNFISANDLRIEQERINAAHKSNLNILNEEMNSLSKSMDMRQKISFISEKINEHQKELNNLHRIEVDLAEKNIHMRAPLKSEFEGQKNKLKEQIKEQNKILDNENKRLYNAKKLDEVIKNTGNNLKSVGKSVYDFMMKSDAAIKKVNLSLGLSGERALIMRESFEAAARSSAHLGMDMEGLAEMASVYADETGRARLHNADNLNSMTLIAKGTNLGVEGAARMAGQYEMMGYNATDTANEVQRILDTTERMGINSGKVLKAVNKNFKTLQKYTFRGGSQGMADMAIYAEKFKINMDEVFNSLEKGRALDSVIEMSAQLQVLGGQFANLADPMSMLFESRNDPEAYTKRINEMTKGMVTMRKEGDKFELQIASPMAQDQIAAAAKALGMTTDELTTQAFRMREIQQTRSQMFNKGFTSKEKELIEGFAKFDNKTGRMFVEIGRVSTDVSNIGAEQLKLLKSEQVSLKERTEASQTFDDAFKNTVMELKTAFLPLLKSINSAITTLRPTIEKITTLFDESNGWGKALMTAAGLFVIAGVNYVKAATIMGGSKVKDFVIGKIVGGKYGSNNDTFKPDTIKKSIGTKLPNKKGDLIKGLAMENVSNGVNSPKTTTGAGKSIAKGFGNSSLGKGLGIGGAAVGIGAGIGAAAFGISKLADSMAKLDETQIWALPATVLAIGGAASMLAPAITALGTAAGYGSLGLLAIGAAAVGVGYGINLATKGIGSMVESFSTLDNVDLSGIGSGMLSIGSAALMVGNPLGVAGLAAMTASISAIGLSANNIERVGNGFYNIGAVMKGSKQDFKEVRDIINDISSFEMNSNNGFAQLAEMLSKPLKVEFSDKEVGFVANIDLTMGGNKFYSEVAKKLPVYMSDLKNGSN